MTFLWYIVSFGFEVGKFIKRVSSLKLISSIILLILFLLVLPPLLFLSFFLLFSLLLSFFLLLSLISLILRFKIISFSSFSCLLFSSFLPFSPLSSLLRLALLLLLLLFSFIFSFSLLWFLSSLLFSILLSINSNLNLVKWRELINSLFSSIWNRVDFIFLSSSSFSFFALSFFILFFFPNSSIFKFISILSSFSSFLSLSTSCSFSFFLFSCSKNILSKIFLFGLIQMPFLSKDSNLSIILIVSCTKLYRPFNCFPFLIKLNIFLFGSISNNFRHPSSSPGFISFNWSNLIVTFCIQFKVDSLRVLISKLVLWYLPKISFFLSFK